MTTWMWVRVRIGQSLYYIRAMLRARVIISVGVKSPWPLKVAVVPSQERAESAVG